MIQRVLVTGGAGFIGSHVADACIASGAQVTILDSLASASASALHPDAEFIHGDIRNHDDVVRALRDIDTVIHCAALVSAARSGGLRREYEDVNVRGTEVLADAIQKSRAVKRVILTSSMMVYGAQESGSALQEEMICNPMTVYGRTKLAQERRLLSLSQQGEIPVTILRLFNVYGPRQQVRDGYSAVVSVFLEQILKNERPILYERGTQTRDFVFVDDVVRAVMSAIEKDEIRTLNIGTGEATSIAELADLLLSVTGSRIRPILTDEPWGGDMKHCHADIRHTAELLGWQPAVPVREGLQKTLEWSLRYVSRPRKKYPKTALLFPSDALYAAGPTRRR